MMIIDPFSGLILSANQAATDYYGYSQEEFRGLPVSELNTMPVDTIASLLATAAVNEANHFTVIHRLADGTERNVDVISWPIQHRGQIYLSSIIHDVTDRETTRIDYLRNAEQMRRAEIITEIGYWSFNLQTGHVTASDGARRIYGLGDRPMEMAIVQSLVHGEDRPMMDRALEELLAGHEYNVRFRMYRLEDGELRYIHSMAEYDAETATVFGTIHDITDQTMASMRLQRQTRRFYLSVFFALAILLLIIFRLAAVNREKQKAEKRIGKMVAEKDMLLREVHHRIKNNMSTVANLLSLQADMVDNPDAREALEEAQGRVRSMLIIYQRLYQSEAYGQLQVREYIESLAEEIQDSFNEGHRISLNIDVEDFTMDAGRLFYLGILINELLTNSVKYAFPDERYGNIYIRSYFDETEKMAYLQIKDDGIGFPVDFDRQKDAGFGLTLIDIISSQLNAESSFETENGTSFSISFVPCLKS
ncbi:hypothetical protein JCM12856_01440 [Spirochaeta dissipatitropha]